MRQHRLGPRALLVEVLDAHAAAALARWAREQQLVVGDVVPAAESVLFDDVADVDELSRRLLDARPTDGVADGPLVEVPVTFDGPDLAFVASEWDLPVAGVVDTMRRLELVSAFCGFAPGFAYLSGLPAGLAVPRMASPRSRVPPGSVAVADRWCGIYPTASPGGWRLVGRTDAVLWDADRPSPALLAPGTRVRLVPG